MNKSMYDVIDEIRKLEEKYGEDFNWGTDFKNEFFESELRKELALEPSFNVKAIARSYSNDDVLFEYDDKVFRIYHLTYSGGEPRYQEFTDGRAVVDYIERQFVEEYCEEG
ncbi:hypothetical protein [Butyrivibrio proteoclasticus]|uniref:hypothetical protein n=1 Tax=Butyrivibrio proteoclasticus TaxID=43305 RepID=UPI001FA7686D|nr:hypothetical protein [Butyrivibrio proteoclasticus]